MCPSVADKQLSIIQETVIKSKNAYCVIDKDLHISFCNEIMGKVVGIHHHDIIGRHQDEVMLEAHHKKTGIKLGDLQITEWINSVKYHQEAMDERFFILHTAEDKHYKFYRMTLSTGEHVILGTDITELINTQNELNVALEKLDLLARTCDLTGIPNRRHVIEFTKREFARARRYSSSFSIVFVDVDHFKRINDTYGHAIGDKAIIHVANLLNEELRETDIVGRIGGEEFAILLPDTNESNAVYFANRLRETLFNSSIEVDNNNTLKITASFGVTEFNKNDKDYADIFTRADDALYTAKNSGRNKVCRYKR